jgi:hypothetical protein
MNYLSSLSPEVRAALRPDASQQQRRAATKQVISELVGVTFFGQLLKMARNTAFKGDYGHGGRGEEIFRGQLDMHLVQRASKAMSRGLHEALYSRYIPAGLETESENGQG